MKKARNEFSSLFLYDYAAFSVLYTSIGIESSKIRMDMRLLILSFFAALLGYSLLFERREVKPTDDYSFMDWLSITPDFPSLCTRKQDFVFLK